MRRQARIVRSRTVSLHAATTPVSLVPDQWGSFLETVPVHEIYKLHETAGFLQQMQQPKAQRILQCKECATSHGACWGAGEIMAAYADGGFTLEQAMCVAYERASRAVQAVQQSGVPSLMAAVGLSEEACTARLRSRGLSSVAVACDNSPSNVTVSGGYTNFHLITPCCLDTCNFPPSTSLRSRQAQKDS